MCHQRRLRHAGHVAEVSATVVAVAASDVVDAAVVAAVDDAVDDAVDVVADVDPAVVDDELAVDGGLKALFGQANQEARWARRLDLSID